MFTPTSQERAKTFSDVVKHVNDSNFSLDAFTVASGSGILKVGTVMGQATLGSATSAVKASGANTGNATMSAVTVLDGAVSGIYTVRMLTATTFRVEKPNGDVIGDGATGTAFADDIGFTMTAGGTPMVAGDGFDVTVAPGSLKWKPHDPAAVDGSQVAAGVLGEAVDATSADVVALGVKWGAIVVLEELIFKSGISAPNRAAAIASLGAPSRMILARGT